MEEALSSSSQAEVSGGTSLFHRPRFYSPHFGDVWDPVAMGPPSLQGQV